MLWICPSPSSSPLPLNWQFAFSVEVQIAICGSSMDGMFSDAVLIAFRGFLAAGLTKGTGKQWDMNQVFIETLEDTEAGTLVTYGMDTTVNTQAYNRRVSADSNRRMLRVVSGEGWVAGGGRRSQSGATGTCLKTTIRIGSNDCMQVRSLTAFLANLQFDPVGSTLLGAFTARYGAPLGFEASDVSIPFGGVLPVRGDAELLSQCGTNPSHSSGAAGQVDRTLIAVLLSSAAAVGATLVF